jgi:hypothetical protein
MTLWKTVFLCSALFLETPFVQPQTDAEAVTLMQDRASLACADYSTDRAKPGISGVPVDALRVLLKHKYLVCPDRRISGQMAVVWYPRAGVLSWSPSSPASVHALAHIADKLTRTEDFPQGITVWDEAGTELRNQIVPEFHFKETYDPSR